MTRRNAALAEEAAAATSSLEPLAEELVPTLSSLQRGEQGDGREGATPC